MIREPRGNFWNVQVMLPWYSQKKFVVVGNKVSFLDDFDGHSNMTSHTFIETYLKIVEFTGKLELYWKPQKILSASLLAIVRKDTGGRSARNKQNKTRLNATFLHVQKSLQKPCGKLWRIWVAGVRCLCLDIAINYSPAFSWLLM